MSELPDWKEIEINDKYKQMSNEDQKAVQDWYATTKYELEGPPKPPTPEQEAVEANPWVDDPFTMGLSLFGGGVPGAVRGLHKVGGKIISKAGAKVAGKLAETAAVGSISNIPVDQVTDILFKNHPVLSVPFNIIAGTYSGNLLQKAINNRVNNITKLHKFTATEEDLVKVSSDIYKASQKSIPAAKRMEQVIASSQNFEEAVYKIQQLKLKFDLAESVEEAGVKVTFPSGEVEKIAGKTSAIPPTPEDLQKFFKTTKLKKATDITSGLTKDVTKLKTQVQTVLEKLAGEEIPVTSTTKAFKIGDTPNSGPLNLRGGRPAIPTTVIKPVGVLTGKPPYDIRADVEADFNKMVKTEPGAIDYSIKSGGIVVDSTKVSMPEATPSTYTPPGSFGMSQVKTKKVAKQKVVKTKVATPELSEFGYKFPDGTTSLMPKNALFSSFARETLSKIPENDPALVKLRKAYVKKGFRPSPEKTLEDLGYKVIKPVLNKTRPTSPVPNLDKTELLSDGVVSRTYNKMLGDDYNYDRADEWLRTEGYKLYNLNQAGKKGDIEDIVVTVSPKKIGYLGEKGAVTLPGSEDIKEVGRMFKEFFLPFSSLPDEGKALFNRYKLFGAVDKADEYVQYISSKLNNYNDIVNKDIFKYLNGDIDLNDIEAGGKWFELKSGAGFIPESRIVARQVRLKLDQLGKQMVKAGFIPQETFDKLQGKYVPYIMAKHILGEKGQIILGAGGKLNLSNTIARNPDITYEQRQALGLIEDASKVIPIGIGRTLVDLAKADYLTKIADDAALTWTPGMVKVSGFKRAMGIGKAEREMEELAKVVISQPNNPAARDLYNRYIKAVELAKEATGNLPKDFTQLPKDIHYGDLAGAFVRSPIAADIIPLQNMAALGKDQRALHRLAYGMWNIEAEGVKLFKMSKVTVSPVSWSHNVVSNILQNWLRGRSLIHLPKDYITAANSIIAKDDMFKEAKRFGLFRTNFILSDVQDVYDVIKDINPTMWSSFMSKARDLSKYYGKIDDLAKFAIYHQIRRDGGDIQEAVLESQKWGMDYSLASRSVKYMSQHAIPFLRYQYKIIPLLAESLTKRPWQIPLMMSAPLLVMKYSQHTNNMNEEEWDILKRQIPTFIRNNNSYALLPWKTEDGRWQWISLDGFMPYGNMLGILRGLKHADIKPITDMLGGPWIDLIATMKSVVGEAPPRDNYTGEPIYDRIDPPGTKAMKTVNWLYTKWAPSALTIGERSPIATTFKVGGEDKWGRKITPFQAASKWLGIGTASVSPQQAIVIKKAKVEALRKEMFKNVYAAKTPAERVGIQKRFQMEVRKVMEN